MLGELLNRRWETLLNTVQRAQTEAQEVLDESQAEYHNLKREQDEISTLLSEIWPSALLLNLPLFWRLGFQTWRETPDEWRADYVARVRAGLRSAQSEFERSLDRQVIIPGLRLREQHRRTRASSDVFVQSWLGVESQVRDFLHAVQQARADAQWLLALPLPRLRRPRRWLAQRIPIGRAGTDYDASNLSRISRAQKQYEQAMRTGERIWAWISPETRAAVQWEKIKVDFFRALVPPRMDRLGVLVAKAEHCLRGLTTPSERMMLDIAEMFWLLHQLTPHGSPEASSTAAYWYRQCAVTATEPDIRALASIRLSELDLLLA